jgi:hypothetical protein
MTRHFVVYHNAQKMGHATINRFRAYTNKPLRPDIIGDSVWVIAGLGSRTKEYCLACRFTVSNICPSDNAEFKFCLEGAEGTVFDPPVTLDELPWFRRFRRSQANFSFGFRKLTDEQVIGELENLSVCHAENGIPSSNLGQPEFVV